MPDPFALLPLPLKIFILNDLQDLVSLHAILVASPSAYRIFNVHYTEILSCILTHYPSHLLHLVYIILSIRARPAQIRAQCSRSMQSFDAFRATTILDNNTNAGMTQLPTATTSAAPWGVLSPLPRSCRGLCESFLRRSWRELIASNHIVLARRSPVIRSGIKG